MIIFPWCHSRLNSVFFGIDTVEDLNFSRCRELTVNILQPSFVVVSDHLLKFKLCACSGAFNGISA